MIPRSVIFRVRCFALLAALLCVLLARVIVPAGWMPVARDGGVVLAPCSGMGVAPVMPDMAMHGADEQQRHPDPGGDHPCAGAGVSVAITLPAIDLPQERAVRPPVATVPIVVAVIGLGLAAPPPPQTGPPITVLM